MLYYVCKVKREIEHTYYGQSVANDWQGTRRYQKFYSDRWEAYRKIKKL